MEPSAPRTLNAPGGVSAQHLVTSWIDAHAVHSSHHGSCSQSWQKDRWGRLMRPSRPHRPQWDREPFGRPSRTRGASFSARWVMWTKPPASWSQENGPGVTVTMDSTPSRSMAPAMRSKAPAMRSRYRSKAFKATPPKGSTKRCCRVRRGLHRGRHLASKPGKVARTNQARQGCICRAA